MNTQDLYLEDEQAYSLMAAVRMRLEYLRKDKSGMFREEIGDLEAIQDSLTNIICKLDEEKEADKPQWMEEYYHRRDMERG